MSTVAELVEIIEDRNEKLRREREHSAKLYQYLNEVLNKFVETEEGFYTFKDGECMQCKDKFHS